MEERARVATAVVVFWFLVTVLALYLGYMTAHPRLLPAVVDWVVGVGGGCAAGTGFTAPEGGDVPARGCLQIARDAFAILAFFVGALWASWIFFSVRPFSAYATIKVEVVEVWRHPTQGARALVRVCVQNTGRIRLLKQRVTVMLRPVDELQLQRTRNPRIAETPWIKAEEKDQLLTSRVDIFERMDEALEEEKESRNLDPGSEIAEQVLVYFSDHKTLKVQVEFIALPSAPVSGWIPREKPFRTYRGWTLLQAAQGEDREERPADEEAVRALARQVREELDQRKQKDIEEMIQRLRNEADEQTPETPNNEPQSEPSKRPR